MIPPERSGAVAAAEREADGADPYIGQSIFEYRITRQIGRGGMGAVYEAVHETLKQRAALKVLIPELADDPDYIQRFMDEARAASLVQHPGLVKIYNLGRMPDGAPYILMEFLSGESLQSRIERLAKSGERPSLPRIVDIVRQIAQALEAVHKKGITHRDLKPANVMLVGQEPEQGQEQGQEQQVKIVDFGIAKFAQSEDGAAARQTTEGRFLGTAIYASPEQCRTEGSVGAPSDVYSLGIIFYELVAGRPPFSGGTGAVMGMHIFQTPRPLKEHAPALPMAISKIVHRMLAKAPQDRPSMSEVAALLGQAPSSSSSRLARFLTMGTPQLVAITAALAAALGLGAWSVRRSARAPVPAVARPESAPPSRPAPAPATETIVPASPIAVPAPAGPRPQPEAAPAAAPPARRRPAVGTPKTPIKKETAPPPNPQAVSAAPPSATAPASESPAAAPAAAPAAPEAAAPAERKNVRRQYQPVR